MCRGLMTLWISTALAIVFPELISSTAADSCIEVKRNPEYTGPLNVSILCDGPECINIPVVTGYSGTSNKITFGQDCQRWDSQSPHTHSYTDPADFPDGTLADAANYCRDPSSSGWPWCYVIGWTSFWNYCPIETYVCSGPWCFNEHHQDYQGKYDATKDGIPCQRWDSNTPHTPWSSVIDDHFPDGTIEAAANYCRDPSGGFWPWCYTTDPNVRWDFCPFFELICPESEMGGYMGFLIGASTSMLHEILDLIIYNLILNYKDQVYRKKTVSTIVEPSPPNMN